MNTFDEICRADAYGSRLPSPLGKACRDGKMVPKLQKNNTKSFRRDTEEIPNVHQVYKS